MFFLENSEDDDGLFTCWPQQAGEVPKNGYGELVLKSDYDLLQAESEALMVQSSLRMERALKAEAKLDKAVLALEFYGDVKHWHQAWGSCSKNSFTVNGDCGDVIGLRGDEVEAIGGKLARKTLAEIGKG
jgi:hypothetical protein